MEVQIRSRFINRDVWAGKRSRLQMYIDVLDAIRRGRHKPTRIMYTANLSWAPLHEILTTLIDRGLVTKVESGRSRRYYLTEKGENVLRQFGEAVEELVL